MSGQYELTSLRPRSPQQSKRSRSSLVAQLWFTRVPTIIRGAVASWSAVRATQYTLISDIDDMGNHGRDAVHTRRRSTLRSLGHQRLRRLIWTVLIILPSLAVVTILLVAVFYPSYSHPPHHYDVLRAHALISTNPGRINIHDEKIFIASSIYDKQGRLASGPWAQNLLDLIDLLGPENVFLSVFEDDPDSLARISLEHFSKRVSCGSIRGVSSFIADWFAGNSSLVAGHVDRAALPHIKLPNGQKKLKRIEFLAHVRNRALAPLEDPESSAYSVRFDKLLYLNDVVFDPIDAANLIFSTNVDETGKAKYHAACAADFIDPFKYYDTFATRDDQGNRMGVPIYPWFGDAKSREDVLDQKDAVKVRSCWGGMVAFNARWFQPDSIHVDPGVANMTSSKQELADAYNTTIIPNTTPPIRFRASADTFWDASECCLIHADIEAAVNRSGSLSTDIFLNPYIRVAYTSGTLSFLRISRRFERLFAPFQKMLGMSLGLPTENPRRIQEVGQQYEDIVWEYDDTAWMTTSNMSGGYKNITRAALPGGFCGSRKLLTLGEGDEMREWFNEAVEVPSSER
jgi:hypothetical protein